MDDARTAAQRLNEEAELHRQFAELTARLEEAQEAHRAAPDDEDARKASQEAQEAMHAFRAHWRDIRSMQGGGMVAVEDNVTREGDR